VLLQELVPVPLGGELGLDGALQNVVGPPNSDAGADLVEFAHLDILVRSYQI